MAMGGSQHREKELTTKEKRNLIANTNRDIGAQEGNIEYLDHYFASGQYKRMVTAYQAILALPEEARFSADHWKKYSELEEAADAYLTYQKDRGNTNENQTNSAGEYTKEALRLRFAKELKGIGTKGYDCCTYADEFKQAEEEQQKQEEQKKQEEEQPTVEEPKTEEIKTEEPKAGQQPEIRGDYKPIEQQVVIEDDFMFEEEPDQEPVFAPPQYRTPEPDEPAAPDIRQAPPQPKEPLINASDAPAVNAVLDPMAVPVTYTPVEQPKVEEKLPELEKVEPRRRSNSVVGSRPDISLDDAEKVEVEPKVEPVEQNLPPIEEEPEIEIKPVEQNLPPVEEQPKAAPRQRAGSVVGNRPDLSLDDVAEAEPEVKPVNANTDPIFSPEQLEGYNRLFKKYAGSSSPEYQKLEAAYRKAVQYDEAVAADATVELSAPGLGEKIRQELHRAAANYYNAKLPQEQNETRSNRMEMARKLFHETAPDRKRGEEWRDIEAELASIAKQPDYKPLSAEQVAQGGALSYEEREKAYERYLKRLDIDEIDAIGKEANRLAKIDGQITFGKGLALAMIYLEAQKIKEKLNAGELDSSLLDEIKNKANSIPRMADARSNNQASENKLSAEEKALIARVQRLKRRHEMTDDELRDYEERLERRNTVESYRDKLQKMQESLKNTERRFFNNDSKEYKAMAAEVGNMLEFLNGSMLDKKKVLEIIDLDSDAFKFRLNKLQSAAAGYSNAKMLQDKNANRQTRFDIAGELMELPDLNTYREELTPKTAELTSNDRFMIASAIDNADLQTAEGAAAFVNDENIKKAFEADNFEDLLNDFDEVNIDAVRGAKQVYDILKKEQQGRALLSDNKEHTAAELAAARRSVLLGVGIREYITENAASFTEPEENSPLFNYFSSLGEEPGQLDKVKSSLLQNTKSVTALEKKVRDIPDFRASGRALVFDEPEVEVEQRQRAKSVVGSRPDLSLDEQPKVKGKQHRPIDEIPDTPDEIEEMESMSSEEIDDLLFRTATGYNVPGRANEAVTRLQQEVSQRSEQNDITAFEKTGIGNVIVALQKIGAGKTDPKKQLEGSEKVSLAGIAAYEARSILSKLHRLPRGDSHLGNDDLIAAVSRTDLYKGQIQNATGEDLVNMGMDKFSAFKNPKFIDQFKNAMENIIAANEKAPQTNEVVKQNTKTNDLGK